MPSDWIQRPLRLSSTLSMAAATLLCALLMVCSTLAWAQANSTATEQADAAATLQGIAKQLTANTPAVLRGQFVQRKTIAGFKKPLVSEGRFVVARERGLMWTTDTPFPSELLIKPNQLVSINAGQKEVLDATREPGLRAFNQLIIALLAGDVSALQSQFDVVHSANSHTGWELRLRPKEAGMARFIQEIAISGGDFVEQVLLQEGSSDSSQIEFSAQQASTLTAQEQALL